jgi:hypothetical protein
LQEVSAYENMARFVVFSGLIRLVSLPLSTVELCAASDFVNDINILIAWLIILRYNVSLLDESATTAFSGTEFCVDRSLQSPVGLRRCSLSAGSAVDNTSFIETMGLRGKVNPAEVEATLKDLLKPWLTAVSSDSSVPHFLVFCYHFLCFLVCFSAVYLWRSSGNHYPICRLG